MDYDSILTAVDSNCVNRSEFYKTGKNVPDHDIAMAERVPSVSGDGVMLGVLLGLSLAAAFVLSMCRNILLYRLKDFFHSTRKSISTGMGDSSAEPYYIFTLVMITALSASIPVFQLQATRCTYTSLTGFPYWILAACFAAVTTFIYLKWCIYKIVDWTFFSREKSVLWHHAYLFITGIFSFILLPASAYLLLSGASDEIVIRTLLFVIICYETTLILKLFINFRPRKHGLFSFFLYFCSAELIPALILWRLHDVAVAWLSVHHIVE